MRLVRMAPLRCDAQMRIDSAVQAVSMRIKLFLENQFYFSSQTWKI